MATLPWQQLSQPEPTRMYVAMLTYLPLRKYRSTPRFISYIGHITRQLAKTQGLITFSMRAHPIHKDYWTLSVWEDEAAIGRYISTPPHKDIMHKMAGSMGATKFISWTVTGSELPLIWDDALKRQEQV